MVQIIENEKKVKMSIECCKKIDIKLIEKNYILINLKEGKITINRDNLNCDACGLKQEEEERFLKFKGIFLCNKCLEDIKNSGEMGIVYY